MTRPLRAGTGMRLLRAAVFTAVCVVLSAAGHSLAAGHTVPVWKLLIAWPAVFAVVAPLAGRERGLPGIAAGLTVGQIALHVLFSAGEMCVRQTVTHTDSLMSLAGRLLCAGQAARLTPQAAEHVVRQAGIDPAQLGDGAMSATAMTPAGMSYTSSYASSSAPMYAPSMLVGHLLAAMAVGWLLRRGDAALWRLAELSAGLVHRAIALVRALVAGELAGGQPAPPLRGRFGPGYESGPPHTALLRHSLARRGPPVLALAA